MALCAAIVVACTPARREVRTDAVRGVHFEGNGGLGSGHNDVNLRRAMELKASPSLTFVWPFTYFNTPVELSLPMLDSDAIRLEVWYAHHGWFDARVDGWAIRRIRPRTPKRGGVVDVIGHVVPGPVSTVSSFEVSGSYSRTVGIVVQAALAEQTVRVGERFDLDAVDGVRRHLITTLQDNTYAYAAVTPTIQAVPARQDVSVALDVVPGIPSRLGEIRVHGLKRVDADLVLASIELDPGDAFKATALREAQLDLFTTQLFSVVEVKPDLSDPTNPDVPIDIDLVESKFRSFRVGLGVQYDYFTVSPRLTVSYKDVQLGGSGTILDLDGSVGAYIGVVRDDAGDISSVLPTGRVSAALRYPWLVGGRLGVFARGSFLQDAQFGSLPYWKVQGRVGATYKFSRKVSLTFGPTVEHFRYLEPGEAALAAAQAQFGGDFVGARYTLLAFDVTGTIDFRDDKVQTHRGTFWNLDLRQSIPVPGFDIDQSGMNRGGFLYTKLDGEVRGWIPLRVSKSSRRKPLVLGGKLRLVALLPWQQDAALPYPDLSFIGGPTSLRSYRLQQVGPYATLCTYRNGRPNPQHNNGDAYDLVRTYLPDGGAASGELVGEARYDLPFGLSFAVFGELGILAPRVEQLNAGQFRYGGGVGLRYLSPVGPIRLDVGLRPVFQEDLAPSAYIGCNPIDRIPRGFDLLTGTLDVRSRLQDRTFPMAINLTFAIGEAF